jgi:hypothetical protein
MKIFRATRGVQVGTRRWGCHLERVQSAGLGACSRLGTDLGHAFAFAAGQAGMTTLSMIYAAVVAATAFVSTCATDEDLSPPQYAL